MHNKEKILIYDGNCNLCQSTVKFLQRHDTSKRIHYIPNQSEDAKEFLSRFSFDVSINGTVFFIDQGNLYIQSTAVLRVLKALGFPCSIFYIFIVIPNFLRNGIYKFIARNRYKWFGSVNN